MVALKKKRGGLASRLPTKRRAQEVEDLSSDDEDDVTETVDILEDEKKVLQNEENASDESADSDRELQIALRDGLLKSDRLNYVVQKKRPIINKTTEIKDKINDFAKKLPWIETLEVSTQSSLTADMIDNDFEREMQFYKQAEKAVQIAVPRLLTMNIKVLRPSDYYAEMAKSDGHMQRIRKRLLKIQEGKERQEAIRRMREEKKFATKVQRQVIDNKNQEKKKLMEAVKKHKKGMKQQLDDMLNNVKRLGLGEEDAPAFEEKGGRVGRGGFGAPRGRGSGDRNFKKQFKSDKFGYGGKKKGMKRNDKSSFDDMPEGSKFGGRGGAGGFGRGGGGGFGRGRGGGRGGPRGGGGFRGGRGRGRR